MTEIHPTLNDAIARTNELFIEEVRHYRETTKVYESCLESYFLFNEQNGILEGVEFEGAILLNDPEKNNDPDYQQIFIASLRPNLEAVKKNRSRATPRAIKNSDLEITTWILEKIGVKDED